MTCACCGLPANEATAIVIDLPRPLPDGLLHVPAPGAYCDRICATFAVAQGLPIARVLARLN